ncbi:BMP family ABC transporter substrate-binding protein [Halobiforma lacisalsi AJ5]|uniref:BMP family ABC transporter substrate-binding protein n=1 Tax=Natronobacterium lacisalsi AJ5 TaxID=358396 RepID=M0L7L8_NATLA|nr:BMP family ABC transporter substrate-binding protein [Halobiforma lacisalsi]APW98088.1 BMP family ABC transporter substrate-binding protein [Halobiforma lacisalsi AJ5]EMA28469.1 putative sugar ABC transporter periplasmic substrate-binding protein [Halobiforma lacisalsi AJ5]
MPRDHKGKRTGGESEGIGRRTVLASGAATITATTIAGCMGDDGESAGTNVAIISSPAGFDDNAFNDNAVEGLEEASNDFDLEYTTIEETEEAQYESTQADAAESGYDLIICVGDNHTDPLATNVEQYPDQNWMLINNMIDGADNVSGWIEMNNEMSFLAGVVAGVMTDEEFAHEDSETNPDESIVGFVGGEDIPLIRAFEQSYVEGVEWVNDDAEVLTGYGGSFSDTGAANDVAESQIDDGADIVWHAASAAGAGAFSAAQDNGRFALGVDVDQSVTEEQYQDVILGSAVKALNEATYQVSEAVVEDDFESVVGEQNLSIEDGSIDFVVGQAFEGELPDSVEQTLADAKEAFENDEIELTCGPTSC